MYLRIVPAVLGPPAQESRHVLSARAVKSDYAWIGTYMVFVPRSGGVSCIYL